MNGWKAAGLEQKWLQEGKQQQHSKAGAQPDAMKQNGLLHSSWWHYLLNRH